MMKVLISTRLDHRVRDQILEISQIRGETVSSVAESLIVAALGDRHVFIPLGVAPLVCQVCQQHRGNISHLTDAEAESLRTQLEAQGMVNHPDLRRAAER